MNLDLRSPSRILHVTIREGLTKSFPVIAVTRGMQRQISEKLAVIQEEKDQLKALIALDDILQVISPGSNFDDIPMDGMAKLISAMTELSVSDSRPDEVKKKQRGRPARKSVLEKPGSQKLKSTG